MGEDGGVGDDQGCAGGATGGLQLGLPFVRKGNNREMAGVRVSFQLGDGVGHLAIARKKVGKNEQGFFLLGASDQRSGAGDGQHAVVEILQPIHQLGAGEQFLVQNKRERLRHVASLKQSRKNSKNFRNWADEKSNHQSTKIEHFPADSGTTADGERSGARTADERLFEADKFRAAGKLYQSFGGDFRARSGQLVVVFGEGVRAPHESERDVPSPGAEFALRSGCWLKTHVFSYEVMGEREF